MKTKKNFLTIATSFLLVALSLMNIQFSQERLVDLSMNKANAGFWDAVVTGAEAFWNAEVYECEPAPCYDYDVGGSVTFELGLQTGLSGGAGYDFDGDPYYHMTGTVVVGIGIAVDISISSDVTEGEDCVDGSSVAHCWECDLCALLS